MGFTTPDIKASKPIVKEAKVERVYDNERLFHLAVTSFRTGYIDLGMEFRNYIRLEDGTVEDADEPQRMIHFDNILEFIQENVSAGRDANLLNDFQKVVADVEALAHRIKTLKESL